MKKIIIFLFFYALGAFTTQVFSQCGGSSSKQFEKYQKRLTKCDGDEQWGGYLETSAGRVFFFHRKDVIEAHWIKVISDSIRESHTRSFSMTGYKAIDIIEYDYFDDVVGGDLYSHTKPKRKDTHDQIFLDLLKAKDCPKYLDITYHKE